MRKIRRSLENGGGEEATSGPFPIHHHLFPLWIGRWHTLLYTLVVLSLLVAAFVLQEASITKVSTTQKGTLLDETNKFKCTAQLLTTASGGGGTTTNSTTTSTDNRIREEASSSGCWRQNDSADRSPLFYWSVSTQVQEACRLPKPHIVPLQSTAEDIEDVLSGKWILLIGDSSTRMLYDYFIGRWLGNYTHWPSKMTHRGPESHSMPCQGYGTCHYDVFIKGARVTFVWLSQNMTTELDTILQQTVGVPDMVVGQHGYWEQFMPTAETAREHSEEIVRRVTDSIAYRELKSEYPSAYAIRSNKPYKMWMTSFDPNFLGKFGQGGADGSFFDGSRLAGTLGWDILDRTFFGMDPHTLQPEGAHPMNEVLELELEILLLIIRNIPSK